jgi:hypothetical protein
MTNAANKQARIFHVDTMFQQLARKPGGLSREEAMAGAQRNVEKLKPDVAEWLFVRIQNLAEIVSAAEADAIDARSDRLLRGRRTLRQAHRAMPHQRDFAGGQ